MNYYSAIAHWYDIWQDSLKPDQWAQFIRFLDQRHGPRQRSGEGADGKALLVDLGCGTARISLALERLGYDIIGIDHSEAMLQVARDQASQSASKALFLQQDISSFELYGTVDLVTCLLDTVNHILQADKILQMFRLCQNYLNQDALLILDLASKKHFSQTLANNVFYQDLRRENGSGLTLLWQNSWQPDENLSISEITIFAETENELYKRYDDIIRERFYELAHIVKLAEAAGLKLVGVYAELQDRPALEDDERNFLVFVQPEAKQEYTWDEELI